jgi:putative endonuclease
MSTRATGSTAEDMAVDFLRQLGWKIIGRNLHYRFGEIDILAEWENEIIVVEVKAKRARGQGVAVEMITPVKHRRLRQLAHWVQAEYNKPVRIDVIAIDDFGSPRVTITHYPYAIGE